jgi:hypothetical protein
MAEIELALAAAENGEKRAAEVLMSFDESEEKKEEEAALHSNLFSPIESLPAYRRR